MRLITFSIAAALISIPLLAATLRVPSQYSTIQLGLSAAVTGDTVLIADGTYTGTGNKSLHIPYTGIIVMSENGPENCVIDCEFYRGAFFIQSGIDSTTIIDGFKIINGGGFTDGGAIACIRGSPTIKNCIINNCRASIWGGGIHIDHSDAIVEHCVFTNNRSISGGGIQCINASAPQIRYCVFSGNRLREGVTPIYFCGGGIYSVDSNPVIEHCVISYGSEDGVEKVQGDAVCLRNSAASIRNSIIMNINGVAAIKFDNSPNSNLLYCDIYDYFGDTFLGLLPPGLGQIVSVNANGDSCDVFHNIYLEPLFQAVGGDSAFRLTAGSPCIDAGDPDSRLDPDSTIADIGAYYHHQGLTVAIRPRGGEPVMAPAGGTQFYFHLMVTSVAAAPVEFEAWTHIVLPSGWSG